MTRRRCRWSPILILALSACSVPSSIEQLKEQSPPPEYGRPGWVRGVAGAGSWLGGAIGAAGSVALLPISWPLAKLSGDQLREPARQQLIWFPATGLAAVGHAAFGAPADMLDYTFRRAWIDGPDPVSVLGASPLGAPELPAVERAVEADG